MPIGWQQAQVAFVNDWAEGLRTIWLDARAQPFQAGQFVNLALDVAGERVSRSYSMASAPGEPLEFFLARVPDGALSPSLFALGAGDPLLFNPLPAGRFTLERVPAARVLWLVATGTGLGPFISMLRTDEPWCRFERLVVVHGVRGPEQLAYRQELQALSAEHDARLTWVPVVSRAPHAPDVLHGRVTTSLQDGSLEDRAGTPLEASSSQVLLCGNPAKIHEMRGLLSARGLERNRPRKPGHVTTEAYWG